MKKFWMIFSVFMAVMILFVLAFFAPVLAEQGEKSFFFVNPVWKKLGVTEGNLGKFAFGKGYISRVVTSKEDYRLALIEAIREQKELRISFDPPISSDTSDLWWRTFDFDSVPWFDYSGISGQSQKNKQGNVVSAMFSIKCPNEDELVLEKGIKDVLRNIISPSMSSYQREKAIHDWIVDNVDYDPVWLDYLNGGEHGKIPPASRYRAFFDRKAICATYSALTSEMLYAVGISNYVVDGNIPGGEGHAWNLVNLCGKWYHLDVTWDDLGLYGDYHIYYDWFNLTDEQMKAKGRSWEYKDLPATPIKQFNSNECQDAKPRCSIFHPELCMDELSCIRASEHWCGGKCIDSDYWCLTLSEEKISLREGETVEVSILDGKGPYTAIPFDIGVCTASVSGNTAIVTGVTEGNCTITVDDSSGQSVKVPVAVVATEPIPTDQSIIELKSKETENAPVNLGNVVTGGDQMKLALNFPAYAGPVDEYVAIQIPNGTLFFLGPDSNLTTNIVAYAVGVTVAQKVTVYKAFNVYNPFGQATVPTGKWTVYSLVSLTNGGNLVDAITNSYELLYYSFIIHP